MPWMLEILGILINMTFPHHSTSLDVDPKELVLEMALLCQEPAVDHLQLREGISLTPSVRGKVKRVPKQGHKHAFEVPMSNRGTNV